MRTSIAALAALLLFTACRTTQLVRPTASTDHGLVVGTSSAGVTAYLGIPYAAAPIGALRFKPPVEVAAWKKPLDATARGRPCAQPDGPARAVSDEDCLTLNVWTPVGFEKGEQRPVLVWIHGGAFFQGGGGDRLYDGAKFAARTGAVLVTINYRLGPLGFLAHRELAKEAGREVSPSYGILDQRAALAWVKRNIHAFGGDPKTVTIFGESAGAWSVCVHLVSPKSRGLFARAIMQSGACENAFYFDPESAFAQGDALAEKLGCKAPSALECLRNQSAKALSEALPIKRNLLLPPGVWWGPVVDGIELPKVPLEAIKSGDFNRVPLLIGATRDEGVLHTVGFKEVRADEVELFARDVFGYDFATDIYTQYSRPDPKDSLTDIVTDGIMVCEARRIARAVSAHGMPVYLYNFTHPLEDPRAKPLGATHSVDLFFLFGNHDMGFGIEASEVPLSETIMDAWGRFARTGDPGGGVLSWPRYATDKDEYLELNLVPKVGAHLKSEICDFWDAHNAVRLESATANSEN